MSILKRQRELKKAEKAAAKRARRHGVDPQPSPEPVPTVGVAELMGPRSVPSEDRPRTEIEREHEPS